MNFLSILEVFLETQNELESVAEQIVAFIEDVIMPVFWIGLGGFLIIKGAMVGAQIVKAADEPQVRQEKINSLKYLLIGVAIAAVIAGAAEILIDYLKDGIITTTPTE